MANLQSTILQFARSRKTAENMFTMSARKMSAERMQRVRRIVSRQSIWKRYCLPRLGGCFALRRYWLGFAMKTLPEMFRSGVSSVKEQCLLQEPFFDVE